MRILLIEDDAETAEFVRDILAQEGHAVRIVGDGPGGLAAAREGAADLLVIDRRLPELDGLSIVRTIRADGDSVPVLFLTTLEGIDDRVAGLDAGGDDYLGKPFASAELVARVAALGRRRLASPVTRFRVADLEMDLLAKRVTRGGAELDLQPREFALLETLMRHSGQVLTRSMLLQQVWHFHFDPRTNIVESHMSRLRAKIACGAPELIHTIRGAGYCLRAP